MILNADGRPVRPHSVPGFPSVAGIDRVRYERRSERNRFPRKRGDGPCRARGRAGRRY